MDTAASIPSDPQADLFAEACRVFGITDPSPDAIPRQIAAHRFYGNPELLEPLSVVIVTCGGRKLRYPIDADTEYVLRYQVFNAFKRDKRSGNITELPLPADLSLSRNATIFRTQVLGLPLDPQ